MEKWKEYDLGDVVTLNYGKALKADDRIEGDIPVYSSGGITGWHNSPLVNDEGIIVGRKGTVGTVYYSSQPFFTIDTAYYIKRDDETYDLRFLYYLLQYLKLERLNEDSAVPGLNRNTAYNQKIKLPSIPEQKSIANILSSLDDKIELNRKMNQTLEKMAKAIYKQWFEDFEFPNEEGKPYKSSGGVFDGELPKGWKIGKIKELGKIVCGKTPSKSNSDYYGSDYPFIKIPDMHSNIFILETTDGLSELGSNSQLNKLLPPYSINVSCIATVGLVSINVYPSHTNQQINSIVLIKNIFLEYTYFKMKKMSAYLNLLGMGGTATLNVNTNSFSNIEILIPSDSALSLFSDVTNPLFQKILSNQRENSELQKIRDLLLPKLISGQLTANHE